MKVHNYGMDYAQSRKFRKQLDHTGEELNKLKEDAGNEDAQREQDEVEESLNEAGRTEAAPATESTKETKKKASRKKQA